MKIPSDIKKKKIVMAQSRGVYQTELLLGRHTWSGSSLRGEARKWSARYADSRNGLVDRINEALLPHGWAAYTDLRDKHQGSAGPSRPMRVLILQTPDAEEILWS